MLYAGTKASYIFQKEYLPGYLYLLSYSGTSGCNHSTVEKRIKLIDDILVDTHKTPGTSFVTIDLDTSEYGKVRSFSGDDRRDDEYYRMIFTHRERRLYGQWNLQPGVIKLSASDTDLEMFDVVKKRKAMDAADGTEPDNSPSALAAFEDFESSVLPALEKIKTSDDDDRRQELLIMEDSIAKGIAIPPTGGVYFAWSDCLNCMKIGATRRETPAPRLRELSSYVTSPFKLIAWIPTPTPFRVEAQTHAHFGPKRIRQAGAGTEFFRITDAEAVAYVLQP